MGEEVRIRRGPGTPENYIQNPLRTTLGSNNATKSTNGNGCEQEITCLYTDAALSHTQDKKQTSSSR